MRISCVSHASQVVLDMRSKQYSLVWSEGLALYIILTLYFRILPTPQNFRVHFASLRAPPGTQLAPGTYSETFRWLLGSSPHPPWRNRRAE